MLPTRRSVWLLQDFLLIPNILCLCCSALLCSAAQEPCQLQGQPPLRDQRLVLRGRLHHEPGTQPLRDHHAPDGPAGETAAGCMAAELCSAAAAAADSARDYCGSGYGAHSRGSSYLRRQFTCRYCGPAPGLTSCCVLCAKPMQTCASSMCQHC
jgi:hypothetical protein